MAGDSEESLNSSPLLLFCCLVYELHQCPTCPKHEHRKCKLGNEKVKWTQGAWFFLTGRHHPRFLSSRGGKRVAAPSLFLTQPLPRLPRWAGPPISSSCLTAPWRRWSRELCTGARWSAVLTTASRPSASAWRRTTPCASPS